MCCPVSSYERDLSRLQLTVFDVLESKPSGCTVIVSINQSQSVIVTINQSLIFNSDNEQQEQYSHTTRDFPKTL